MSQTGVKLLPWEDQSVRGEISQFFMMNWTDGKLKRNKHGKMTRAARHRQGQKQYFASILERREREKTSGSNPPVFNPYTAPSGSPLHNPSQHPSRIGSSPAHRNEGQREASIYKDVPQTVDEFLEMFGSPRSGDNGYPTETRGDDEDLETKSQKIPAIPKSNPAPLPPMIVTKRRRLRRETKITDWEEWERERRETLEHIAPESRAKVRMMIQAQHGGFNPPQIKDGVRIRIGSQEKRLGASSTITKPSQTLPVHPPADTEPHRDDVFSPVKSSSDSEGMVIARRNTMKRRLSMDMDSQAVKVHEGPQIKRRISRKSPDFYNAAPEKLNSILSQKAFNSQDTNSNYAQVGRVISPVTSRQRSENNVWRTWLKSASGATHTDKAANGSVGSSQWPPVSPGISEAYPIARDRIRPLPNMSDSPQLDEFDQQIRERNNASDELSSGDSSLIINWDDDISSTKELSRQDKPYEPPFRTRQGQNSQLYFDGIGEKGNEFPKGAFALQAGDRESPAEDPEEAWKAFIFRGDSDEIEQAVFEEARHDAVICKPPSSSPPPNSDPGMYENESNIATIGSVYVNQGMPSQSTDRPEGVEDSVSEHGSDAATVGTIDNDHELRSESADAPEETEASLSETETNRDIQSELDAESEVDETFTGHEEPGSIVSSSPAQEIVSEASHATSVSTTQDLTTELQSRSSNSPEEVTSDLAYDASSSNTETTTAESQAARSISPEVDMPGTENRVSDPSVSTEVSPSSTHRIQTDPASSDMDSMVVEPPKPEMPTTKPKDDFRFAPPKLFVGSRSNGLQPRPPRAAELVSFAKRRGGRQRKRAWDGRADIRALPNYSSDPIEEIDDDDNLQESRFGALELE